MSFFVAMPAFTCRPNRSAGAFVALMNDHRNKQMHRPLVLPAFLSFLCLAPLLGGCDGNTTSRVPQSQGTAAAQKRLLPGALPRPTHIVIVIEENKAYRQIIGNDNAAYLNKLATEGATLRQNYGVMHPSEPNYLALFSGSTQGLTDDSCPHQYSGANLASELKQAGYTFATYSQSLPHAGFRGCHNDPYVRKHNPAVNWQGINVDSYQNQPFRHFPFNFSKLPTISFVIPDVNHDMHSASVAAGDHWLKQNLRRYVRWARQHDSLLIVTWDEDDKSDHNHIPTILVGPMVKPGHYDQQSNHYNLLRTVEAMYQLPLLGKSAEAVPITAPWRNDNWSETDPMSWTARMDLSRSIRHFWPMIELARVQSVSAAWYW